jgi:pyruvate-formate lyase
MTEEIRLQRFVANVFNISGHEDNGLGHVALDYEKALQNGLRGVIADIEKRLSELELWRPDDYQKMLFFKSCVRMCESAIVFANRYAEKAGETAQEEKDAARRQELLVIGEVCRRVPEYPARSFHEALQSFWFLQLLPQIYDS